jgi:hypothetical protein
MSGPIVRKYGFPNFDKIFGEREMQHGVDDESQETEEPAPAPSKARKATGGASESKAKGSRKSKPK